MSAPKIILDLVERFSDNLPSYARAVVSDLKKETADAVAQAIVAGRGRAWAWPAMSPAMPPGRRWSTRRWPPSARSTCWSTTPAAADRSPSTCRWRGFVWAYELNVFSSST